MEGSNARLINVGLVGISGYTGMELARLLCAHPSMRLSSAVSRTEAGRKLGDFYPFLRHLPSADLEISQFDASRLCANCDLVFLAVPSGTAMKIAPQLLAGGNRVVDLSADFRLRDPNIYEEWYQIPHEARSYLESAVFGLPEIYAEKIRQARLIANPGCYPTSIILALFAALKNKLIDPASIIIDSKSGASGAGRKAALTSLFCEVADNFRAYGLPRHRHTPEIEQELSHIADEPIRVSFTPHLVPMSRGILSSIYASLRDKAMRLEEIHKIFSATWEAHPWVRVLPLGSFPETRHVRGSMFCDIGLALDKRTGRLIIISAIDNLCRGASGQALANANLMCGLEPDTGLKLLAPLP